MRYLTPGCVPHTCSALCHPTSPNSPRVPTATANRFHFCNTTTPLQTSHVRMPNNSRGRADDAKCCARVLRTASCPAKLAGPIAVRSTPAKLAGTAESQLAVRSTPVSLAGYLAGLPLWGVGDVQICRRPIPTGEAPVMTSDRDRRPVAWRWRQVLQGPTH